MILFAAPLRGQDAPPLSRPTAAEAAESVALSFDGLVEGLDYRVYDRSGAPATVDDLVAAAAPTEVLLVGEEHDDMVGHAIEVEILESVADAVDTSAPGRTVVLSLEMFERDVQYIVDEYLDDFITEDHFLRSARPWDDYTARYRPLVESARTRGIPVVAANAPRRYVSRVTRLGPESLASLPPEALAYLPPLPYPGPSPLYRQQWDAIMEQAMAGMQAEAGGRGYAVNPNTIWSQALWDASMGHAVSQALVRHVGGLVVHFAGSFHVEEEPGIRERIRSSRPARRGLNVEMTTVAHVEAWSHEDHGPLADFVILTKRPEA